MASHRTSPLSHEPLGRGSALVAFLGTALVLVVVLALWMRLRPTSFGIVPPPAAPSLDRPPAPPEPEGPLARYDPRPVTAALPLDDEERARIELFREARRSVCLISSLSQTESGLPPRPYDEVVRGTGTGFLWDTAGHVVTSYHTVENARGATVTLADGSVHDGWLVGVDREHDLAVMQIDAPSELLVPLPFGTSHDLLVGQRVYSIGYPYELEHTFSAGMVCGLGRSLLTPSGELLRDLIQTDADLHPGSSGGPILDASGRVVGLATAVHREAAHGAGVAFALPVDVMQTAVPRIMREGFEWFPELGLVLESDRASLELLRRLREAGAARGEDWVSNLPEAGVVIAIVEEGGLAAASGLRQLRAAPTEGGSGQLAVRDIIVAVDGRPVASRDEFDQHLAAARARGVVELVVARAGGRATVRLELPG